MKHVAQIQKEFAKEALNKQAASWDDLSYDAQVQYLKAHPKSKKKITKRKGQSGKRLSDLHKNIEEKRKKLKPELGLSKKSPSTDKVVDDLYNNIKDDAKDDMTIDEDYANNLIEDTINGDNDLAEDSTVKYLKSITPKQRKELVTKIIQSGKDIISNLDDDDEDDDD